ncbi:hypothetical protein VTK56DRAFT_4108 [Thermocarpiscus australiensis]
MRCHRLFSADLGWAPLGKNDDSNMLRSKARCARDGQPLLSLAVCNGHLEAVDYLIKKGVDVNAADAKGRTPLMEAALWGYPVIVDKLLKAGASSARRDSTGMTAENFAEESEANDEERHRRHMNYSENPYVAKHDRKLIRGLLGRTFACSPSKGLALDDLADAFFYKSVSTDTISFVTPRTGMYIPTQYKTAAFLHRGRPFPVVSALSGRTGPDNQEFLTPSDGFERLNCQYWMPETMRVAEAFGFEFDSFLQLFRLQPRNRQAKIIVSQAPCYSCVALSEHIASNPGIHFDLRVVEVRG